MEHRAVQTSAALRAAMKRLFAGQPQRTDGRLTKQNLWQEAGVSRATMNRAQTILAEWDAHVAEHGTTTRGEARCDDEIADLKRKLADKARESITLQRRLDAAATAIAALHHDNTLLREDLAAHGVTVIPLHRSCGHEHDQV
ncbi:hypothetical protein [Nonomuraea rubra]|uniref:Uncharacterized protein n=1 Tax=Nonomuraea rubra TaxID=46180 RepID=A0A7X0NX23_9ACTN|nr:hypothetical protein [Nonomuraea rubra]MBB6551213.1 hypothetical protein [Nonomuraea rubra]